MIELNGIQLDKTSAVPLYEQLRKALLEAITSGKDVYKRQALVYCHYNITKILEEISKN